MSIRFVARLSALLVCVAACSDARGTSPVTSPDPIDVATGNVRALRVLPAHPSAERGRVDVWMGDSLDQITSVRVIDATGRPVAGIPVTFRMLGASSPAESWVVPSDTAGVAQADALIAAARDTLFADFAVTAVIDSFAVSANGIVAASTADATIELRAWRDLSRFGGAGKWEMTRLPVDASAIMAILPLGTFTAGDALPGSEAILLVDGSQRVLRTVAAPSGGLVTDIDETSGTITLRVRDQLRFEVSRVTIAPTVWIGKVVQGGEPIGTVRATGSPIGAPDSIGVRVLDATVQRTNYVVPERYGARRSAAFFARYLSDSLRSHAYALVRRAAPDLDGRIDYDRDGTLVGTWFDAAAPRDAALYASVHASIPSAFTSIASRSMTAERDEHDASPTLSRLALTFAYDAERPGQVRVAIGAALLESLGIEGVRAVAWEDPDPATVGVSASPTRYHLYSTDDSSRIGQSGRVLLVQLVDRRTLRVEVVSSLAGESSTFSARATTLVR